MNEEVFNLEVRKFLKKFGVTAQREIEKLVDRGISSGALTGRETLTVRATLVVEGVEGEFVVDGEVALE
jgi:Family of unknown function (DUF6494)